MKTTAPHISWPPPYTIRKSLRAKRILLNVDRQKGVEIILPKRCSEKAGILFFQQNRAWVEKQISELIRDPKNKPIESELPTTLFLSCISQTLTLHYHAVVSAKNVTGKIQDNRIILYGATHKRELCFKFIDAALKKIAQQTLPEFLEAISRECNLPYRKVSIRAQKTIWGSCTSKKAIQLNYKLLFLPPELARYVVIHELCHTVQLNHSKRFWDLVARFDPDFHAHMKALKTGDNHVPAWLTPGILTKIIV